MRARDGAGSADGHARRDRAWQGPCSTLIELSTGDAAYERARGLAAARLGIPIAALLDEASGQEALALTDGLHLVALEEAPPPPPRAPLPRALCMIDMK